MSTSYPRDPANVLGSLPSVPASDPTLRAIEIGQELAQLGENARAAGPDTHSPGTDELHAAAHTRIHRRVAGLLGRYTTGMAESVTARRGLEIGRQSLTSARERLDNARTQAPEQPFRGAGFFASRLVRFAMPALCAATEMAITTPAIAAETGSSEVISGLKLSVVIAALVGIVVWLAGEVAGPLLLRSNGEAPDYADGDLVERLRRIFGTRVAGRWGAILLILGMVGALSWLAVVRQQNADITAQRIQAANAPILTPGGGGLMQGLEGGGAGPEKNPFKTMPDASETAASPNLGPIGLLSIVLFLTTVLVSAAATVASDYGDAQRDISHRARGVRRRQRTLNRQERLLGRRERALDLAGREIDNIVDEELAALTQHNAATQLAYLRRCREIGVQPVPLTFPPIPDAEELTRSLVGQQMPVPVQSTAVTTVIESADDPPQPPTPLTPAPPVAPTPDDPRPCGGTLGPPARPDPLGGDPYSRIAETLRGLRSETTDDRSHTDRHADASHPAASSGETEHQDQDLGER